MTHPVTLIRQGDVSPLVLDSPHSGIDYPDDFQYCVNFADLRRAEDTHVDGLFDFCSSIGASMVAAQFPRSYIDANRSLEEIDPELLETPWPRPYNLSNKARLGKGLIWRMLDDGQKIYARKLSVAEIENRIRHCWTPYHASVKEALRLAYEQHGFFMHISCHSMPSVSDQYSTDQPGLVHPDIVLGDRDGTSADPEITAHLQGSFLKYGYSCWINRPYKGVELIRAYSDPGSRRHSIQLEINRRLYMDEKSLERHRGYDWLRADLQKILIDLQAFCEARYGSL
uniref:N-formylglutamate amidohydrolase n=1 Tax=Limnohabitans sp. TaxID=1907725 RepID=UPI00404772F0